MVQIGASFAEIFMHWHFNTSFLPYGMELILLVSSGTDLIIPSAHLNFKYRQVSNIRRTNSQHLKDSRTVLRLSLLNPLNPDVKSRMKM